MRPRLHRLLPFGAFAALLAATACGTSSPPGTGSDVVVPAACTACPSDCCRLPGDGGYACMNFDHRNPVTMECSCGQGPACDSLQTCCSPDNSPAPVLPTACVMFASQCDPRPTPMP
jgi:hypothetical protein